MRSVIRSYFGAQACRGGLVALCFLVPAVSGASLMAAGLAEKQAYDLPAEDAAVALKLFSEQSGRGVIAGTDLVKGIRTNPVRGEMAPSEALSRMLAGTGLTGIEDRKSGTFAVRNKTDAEKNALKTAQFFASDSSRKSAKENKTLTPPEPMKRNKLLTKLAAMFALIVAPMDAQTAAGGGSATPDEEVVKMSPFVVSESGDVGYLASESLSGSRLRTSLRDIPAPVTVFTEELLKDLGANSVEDAALYGLNSEEFMEIEIGSATGNQMLENGDTANVNVRGQRTTTTRNYFNWALNTDNYNTSRIDISRGPNAILFGISPAGGIANVTTKQAQMRDSVTATFQISSYDSYRASLDVNKVIIDDKLALRINALKDEQNDWRPVLGKKSERLHVAGTFQPFKNTSIRAEVERGVVDAIEVSPWGPMDGISAWFDAGGDDFAAVARSAAPTGGASMGGNATTPRLVAIQDSANPTITDWSQMSRSNQAGDSSLLDFTRIPKETVTRGPGNKQDYDYSTHSIYLEQTIGENFAFQAAYNKRKQDSVWTQVTDWSTKIHVDVNTQLPDGTPNPHAGDFYIEDVFRFMPRKVEADTLQFTASYDLDSARFVDGIASKLLGRHRAAGFYQEEEQRQRSDSFLEVNTTPLPGNSGNASLTHVKNQINRRTYLGDALDPSVPFNTSGAIDPLSLPLSSQTVTTRINSPATGTVTPGMVRSGVNGRETKMDTKLLVLQSYFWDNKVVTTFGYRRDDLKERAPSNTTVNNVVTEFTWDVPFERKPHGILRTQGGLVHVTDWLSVFYNQSNNFNLSGGRNDLFGEQLPNEQGEGKDYGLRFRLLNNRVVVSLAHYETAILNRLTFTGSTGRLRMASNDIWDSLADNVDPIFADSRVNTSMSIGTAEDAESDGTELEITGNLTKRWSFTLNASRSNVIVANTAAPDRRYFETQWSEVWSNFANVPVAATGNRPYATVEEAFLWIRDVNHADRNDTIDNQTQKGHQKFKANLFTNYRFSDGFLKGFSIGGGARYTSRPITRSQLDKTTKALERFYGSPLYLVDLRLGYTTTVMSDKYKLDFRLNIKNLLDKDEYKIITSDSTGAPVRARFVMPRTVSFTSSLTF